jgi:hemolysin III
VTPPRHALTIYALTLLAMLTCSALYNMIRVPHWADRLRRLDQSAIYFKIAGTYTPFVVLFPGSPGFLAGIWAVAIAGASLIVFSAKRHTLCDHPLSRAGLGRLCARPAADRGAQRRGRGASGDGGLLYTGGIAFLLWTACPSTTPSGMSSCWRRPASVTRPSRWRSWAPFPPLTPVTRRPRAIPRRF